MREVEVYFIVTMAVRKSPDRVADWRTGDTLVLLASLAAFPCSDVATLYARLGDVRPAVPVVAPATLPFSVAFQLLEEKFNRDSWHEGTGLYAATPDNRDGATWQMGWGGGIQGTLSLLALGSPESRACVLRNLEFVFAEGL